MLDSTDNMSNASNVLTRSNLVKFSYILSGVILDEAYFPKHYKQM
jgi:hypothetical protein